MERPISRSINWKLLALLPLFSGAALLAYIATSISLGLLLVAASIFIALMWGITWRTLSPLARAEVARRATVGFAAGIVATVVYDLSRWIAVTLFHDTFWPFDIFGIFGHAILGTHVPVAIATVVGFLYHYINGTFFAVSFAIFFAPRGWWAGILWALGLEVLMLGVYPGWLHPKALGELVSISLLGHLAYGITLGSLSRWGMIRLQQYKTKRTIVGKNDGSSRGGTY